MRSVSILFFCLVSIISRAQTADPILSLTQSFSYTSAVTGREEEARTYIKSLFASGTLKEDNLGNLIMTIGSGTPKKLLTAPMDEPGYVVSNINDNGYLRISPIGYGHLGSMYHQFLQGNEIKIGTEKGSVYGVAGVPSSHYEGMRLVRETARAPHPWQEAFIDIGVASAKEVNDHGVRLLDPLTANKKPGIINNEFIAASAAGVKSGVVALATVAQTLLNNKFKGTVVIAFTTLELINGKGLESVVTKYGPFDQVVRFNRFLTESKDQRTVLADKDLPFTTAKESPSKASLAFRESYTPLEWDSAKFYSVGLPSEYTNTPVEMVHKDAINQLVQTWLKAVEDKAWKITLPVEKPVNNDGMTFQTFNDESALIGELISLYGVSGSEKPVRDFILSQLPSWAKPVTDANGNIVLTFGKGKEHIAFVAHMDEVGYVVDSIRSDGGLVLGMRGGLFNWIWEGHAAIIHAKSKDITAVFEPKRDYMKTSGRSNATQTPTVYAGFTSRAQAIDAGIISGTTTVTMPKQMIRLSENKATARGFDDRVGCATLLRVVRSINPDELPFKVTFVWSTEEETGLTGSTFAAKALNDIAIVYPIDTFVSSDDPIDPRLFGYCPLGNGAVIRVIESINIVAREHQTYLQSLAGSKNIKVQYGMTAGGTDGLGFLKYDIPSVPLSWPGRYSHSPIEVMDFRDMSALVELVKGIVSDKGKVYRAK
jgi:putative aminopeptidase